MPPDPASIGANSADIARAAESEAQPFFNARIFPLNAKDATTVNLAALRIDLLHRLEQFRQGQPIQKSTKYVFHKDEPQVQIRQDQKQPTTSARSLQTIPPYLRLTLSTAGATEDEYFLIHFLRVQQRAGGCLLESAIQVTDEDGEFLLIEAADHLPRWIDPDNASGRVWLLDEFLHIIPPELSSGERGVDEDCGPIKDISSALQILRTKTASLKVSTGFQDAAFGRLTSYPSTNWVESVQHRTTAFFPTSVIASAFQRNPYLITRASQAFLGRDSQDMRLGTKMAAFLPQSRLGSSAGSFRPPCVPIQMPRRLYTHLLSARFHPPKSFREEYGAGVRTYWQALDAMTTPVEGAASDASLQNPQQACDFEQGRRWDLGCKLSVGLEIAYHNDHRRKYQRRSGQRTSSIFAPPSHLEQSISESGSSAEYEELLTKLEKLGYFENEMRGSRRWKELEADALQSLRKCDATGTRTPSGTDNGDEDYVTLDWTEDPLLFADISTLPENLDSTNVELLRSHEQSDAWLYEVGETFLDGERPLEGPTDAEEEAQKKLGEFARQVESFIEGKGDVEGAVIDESASDGTDAGDDSDSEADLQRSRAQQAARQHLSKLTVEERASKVTQLLPQLGERVEWQNDGDPSNTVKELMELDDLAESPNQNAPAPEHRSFTGTSLAPQPKSAPEQVQNKAKSLTEDELRRSFAKSAEAMRSSKLSASIFDGVEGDDSDDECLEDDDERLDVHGERESREVRRERARLLDLEPSDSEEEDEPQTKSIPNSVPSYSEDVDSEMSEFLQFASKELGLSDAHLAQILDERRQSGRWVPDSGAAGAKDSSTSNTQTDGVKVHIADTASSPLEPSVTSKERTQFGEGLGKGFLSSKRRPSPRNQTQNIVEDIENTSKKQKKVSFAQAGGDTSKGKNKAAESHTGPAAAWNGFDDLMAAMDARLNEHRASKGLPPLSKEEIESGEIRAEDWALRRPGGASLGSVMKQHQEDHQEEEEDRRSAAASQQGEEDDEPLSARDPAKLEQLLEDQVPKHPDFKETLDRISRERNWQTQQSSGHTSQDLGQSQTMRLGKSAAATIEEIPSDSNEASDQRFTDLSSLDYPEPMLEDSVDDQTAGTGHEAASASASTRARPMPMLEDLSDDDDDNDEDDRKEEGSVKPEAKFVKRGDTLQKESVESSGESDEDDEEMFPAFVASESGQELDADSLANLMASWRAQGGRPGPVGNLVKSLGVRGQAPR